MFTFTEELIDLRVWDSYAVQIKGFDPRTTISSFLALTVTGIDVIWSLKKLLIICLELITAFRWLEFRLQVLTASSELRAPSSLGGMALPGHPMQAPHSLFWAVILLLPESSTCFSISGIALAKLILYARVLLTGEAVSTLVCEGAFEGWKSNSCSVHHIEGTASSLFKPSYWIHLPGEGVKAAHRNTTGLG